MAFSSDRSIDSGDSRWPFADGACRSTFLKRARPLENVARHARGGDGFDASLG